MSDKGTIEDQIVVAIRRVIRAVDLHSRQLVEEHGLTGPQLAVLREISRMGSFSAGALAQAVHLSPPTLSGILDRLERRGLLKRTRSDHDRRSLVVTVTEAGQGILKGAPSLLQGRFKRELEKLEDWEQTMILATLQRVAAMMDLSRVAVEDEPLASALNDAAPEAREPYPLGPPSASPDGTTASRDLVALGDPDLSST